jgi:hypothetical protein
MHALFMVPAIVLGIALPEFPPASTSATPTPAQATSSAAPAQGSSELHWTMPQSSGDWSEAQVDE